MTHSDSFVATRRKVLWALRGGTTAKTDERYPQSSAWQGYAVCGGLECGVCERLYGLTSEVIPTIMGETHQPCPSKSYRLAVRHAPILLAATDT